jgi:hypothetical protein
MSVVENAVEDRLEGERPGRLRSLVVAAAAAAAAAALAYKFLRSGSDGRTPAPRSPRPTRRAATEAG